MKKAVLSTAAYSIPVVLSNCQFPENAGTCNAAFLDGYVSLHADYQRHSNERSRPTPPG
jgi:hypothetical protein